MKRKYIEDAPSENHQSLESAIFQDNIDISEKKSLLMTVNLVM